VRRDERYQMSSVTFLRRNSSQLQASAADYARRGDSEWRHPSNDKATTGSTARTSTLCGLTLRCRASPKFNLALCSNCASYAAETTRSTAVLHRYRPWPFLVRCQAATSGHGRGGSRLDRPSFTIHIGGQWGSPPHRKPVRLAWTVNHHAFSARA